MMMDRNPETLIRVLLVDDDADDHLIISDLLSESQVFSYQIDWVSSYSQGHAAITAGLHDVYLVDYRLGAKTGIDLLREVNHENIKVPFILLTGYGDHQVDIQAMQLGAADYLIKDRLNAQVLERSLRYAIARSDSLRIIREREEGLRSLFDAAFEGIFLHLPDGQIIDANSTAAVMFGKSRTEMIGKNIGEFILQEGGEERKIANSAQSVNAMGKKSDGSEINLEMSTKSYPYGGRICQLTSCRDVTERVQMEAQIIQQDRLASIGLLASSLAHEIGTPLGVIRGRAELMALQTQDPLVLSNSEIIVAQIDRVSTLIHSLLKLARGEQNAAVGSVDVGAVVGDVLNLMAHELKRNGIKIENKISDLVMVHASQGPLHQVLLNLFVNALHAMQLAVKQGRNDGHFLRISAQEKGDLIQVNIEDSGTGISPENLKRLFTPFFTTKDIGSGTGLGLVTSFRIVESWGGDIRVTSKENVGTTFQVLLRKQT